MKRCKTYLVVGLTALGVLLLANGAWATHRTRILLVSAEQGGTFQTGGLAHAVGGLANAFRQEGVFADVAMPYYLQMNKPAELYYTDQHFDVGLEFDQGGHPHRSADFFVIKSGDSNVGQTVFFRHSSTKHNYFDNRNDQGKRFYGPNATMGEAFGAWSKAVADYIITQKYDVVILNDWHTALISLYLDMAKKQGHKVPRTVLAIHNLAFQGVYPYSLMFTLGIPQEYYSSENGLEYYGQISFLKAGILKSDLVYTVSPKYAEEVATPLFGAGLDGLIRRAIAESRFFGVLNGIEDAKWDPAILRDEAVEFTFDTSDLSGKAKGKLALQANWKLPLDPTIPIFVMSSRVVEQKGYEYLPLAIEKFLEKNKAQFVIIGDGDPVYTDKLRALQIRFPDKVRFQAFSESTEKVLKAYGDFFVNAAWFEPSGLNQMFALKNGTIPILSRVGGLSNSVQDGISGFLFDIRWKDDGSGYDTKATAATLESAFERAYKVYEIQPETIKQMRISGMTIDNSWNSRVNNEFMSLFHERLSILLKKPAKTCVETLQGAQ